MRAFLLFAVTLSLTGCSGCSPAPTQATPDASAPVSVRAIDVPGATRETGDAGTSPPPASDAALPDEPEASAPRDPFVGQWDPLPGRPPLCGTRIAANPAASLGRLAWEPCASGRTGCRSLIADWSEVVKGSISFRQGETMHIVNGIPYLYYTRRYRRDWRLNAFMVVIQALDGDAIFAAGDFVDPTEGTCSVDAAIGPMGLAFVAGAKVAESPWVERFGWAPWSDLHAFSTHAYTADKLGLGATQGVVQELVVAESSIFLGTFGPSSVTVLDGKTGAPTLVDRPSRIKAESPMAVGSGAIALTINPPTLSFVKADGSWARLVTPESPHWVTSFAIDRARANQGDIVWVESDRQDVYVNSTIWTSPFATTEAGIQKRRVAALDDKFHAGGANMIVNAGHVLNVVDADKALLTRLSDGKGWLIRSDPGVNFVTAVWVDDTELWISTAAPGIGYQQAVSSIMRLSRASLGEPEVASGF
jgi:hypothetical protein